MQKIVNNVSYDNIYAAMLMCLYQIVKPKGRVYRPQRKLDK